MRKLLVQSNWNMNEHSSFTARERVIYYINRLKSIYLCTFTRPVCFVFILYVAAAAIATRTAKKSETHLASFRWTISIHRRHYHHNHYHYHRGLSCLSLFVCSTSYRHFFCCSHLHPQFIGGSMPTIHLMFEQFHTRNYLLNHCPNKQWLITPVTKQKHKCTPKTPPVHFRGWLRRNRIRITRVVVVWHQHQMTITFVGAYTVFSLHILLQWTRFQITWDTFFVYVLRKISYCTAPFRPNVNQNHAQSLHLTPFWLESHSIHPWSFVFLINAPPPPPYARTKKSSLVLWCDDSKMRNYPSHLHKVIPFPLFSVAAVLFLIRHFRHEMCFVCISHKNCVRLFNFNYD